MKSRTRFVLLVGALVGTAAGVMVSSILRAAAGDAKAEASSVLVETKPVRQGEIADRLIAYGSAVPAINGGMTMSVQAEGRVIGIMATPGEAVHTGQALLEFQLSAAASSTYSQAISAVKLAQGEQTRIARLLEQQLATRDQKALADKAASDAQAALAALEHETGGRQQQTLLAPFDGVVATVPVAQGDRIAAGAPLLTLTRTNGLIVTVGIEPSERMRLKLGQRVEMESLGDAAVKHEGKLARIDRSLNPKTRLVDADIAVEEEILQGDAFRASIVVGQLKGWLVPRDAVLDDDEGAYLFQVDGSKAVRVKVERIGRDEETAVVEGTLNAQREVVVLGNYQLENGLAVRKAPAENDKEDAAKDEKTPGAKKP